MCVHKGASLEAAPKPPPVVPPTVPLPWEVFRVPNAVRDPSPSVGPPARQGALPGRDRRRRGAVPRGVPGQGQRGARLQGRDGARHAGRVHPLRQRGGPAGGSEAAVQHPPGVPAPQPARRCS